MAKCDNCTHNDGVKCRVMASLIENAKKVVETNGCYGFARKE